MDEVEIKYFTTFSHDANLGLTKDILGPNNNNQGNLDDKN
jgi:hypothetical protein